MFIERKFKATFFFIKKIKYYIYSFHSILWNISCKLLAGSAKNINPPEISDNTSLSRENYPWWEWFAVVVSTLAAVIALWQTMLLKTQLTLSDRNRAIESVMIKGTSVCNSMLTTPVPLQLFEFSDDSYWISRKDVDSIKSEDWGRYRLIHIDKVAEFESSILISSMYMIESEKLFLKKIQRRGRYKLQAFEPSESADEKMNTISSAYRDCKEYVDAIFHFLAFGKTNIERTNIDIQVVED